jgi:hypothetical protein
MALTSMTWQRLAKSAVLWSWLFNGLRLASGLILLPLLVRQLSVEELGLHYVLVSLAAVVLLVDFGFSTTIGRAVGYAAGGVQELEFHGVTAAPAGGPPNRALLGQLLHATRHLYRRLTLVALLLLGTGGTWMVGLRIRASGKSTPVGGARFLWGSTASPSMRRLTAWPTD